MKNRYFDEWEFKQAISILESNPARAKIELQQYIEKYPQDYSAYIYYISSLITLGEFEEAEYMLNLVESSIKNNKQLQHKKEKNIKNNIELIVTKLRLLAHQERYAETYQYYKMHFEEIQQISVDIKPLIFYCQKQMGTIDSNKRERYKNTYIFRQITRYEEYDFLDHIKKHLPNQNVNISNPNPCIFSLDFPIDTILTEIKKYIPSAVRLYPNFYVDVYVFKYRECGKVNNRIVDYFKVVCFHNTSNIITIYPDIDSQELPHIDLNYLIQDDKYLKTKRLSQIDKFNKRYGNPISN